MIRNRQHIDLNGRTILEKLIVVPPLRQSPVFQNQACFLYFTEGNAAVSSPTEQLFLKERESVLLKCGTYFADLFQNKDSGTCEVCVIHLYPDVLEAIFKDDVPFFIKQKETRAYSFRIAKKNVLQHFIESLNFYFSNSALASEEIIHLKIKELILLLLHTEAAASVIELYSYLFSTQKASITDVVETHLYSYLNIEELASLAGLSLSSFKREFKKHFGDTPAKYIRQKRLQKAAELLQHSSLTISEISSKIGYEDGSYFSRLFQKQFNCLPTEFRKLSS